MSEVLKSIANGAWRSCARPAAAAAPVRRQLADRPVRGCLVWRSSSCWPSAVSAGQALVGGAAARLRGRWPTSSMASTASFMNAPTIWCSAGRPGTRLRRHLRDPAQPGAVGGQGSGIIICCITASSACAAWMCGCGAGVGDPPRRPQRLAQKLIWLLLLPLGYTGDPPPGREGPPAARPLGGREHPGHRHRLGPGALVLGMDGRRSICWLSSPSVGAAASGGGRISCRSISPLTAVTDRRPITRLDQLDQRQSRLSPGAS